MWIAAIWGYLQAIAISQVQVTAEKGYLRPTIEGYPVDERRPLIRYLDAARIEANKVIQLFVKGWVDRVYEAMIPTFKEQVAVDQFREGINLLKAKYGEILSYDYRNQGLVYPNDTTSMSDLDNAQSQVWYAVKTSKAEDISIFLVVKTCRLGNRHFVARIEFMDYGDNMPSWLRFRDATVLPPQ